MKAEVYEYSEHRPSAVLQPFLKIAKLASPHDTTIHDRTCDGFRAAVDPFADRYGDNSTTLLQLSPNRVFACDCPEGDASRAPHGRVRWPAEPCQATHGLPVYVVLCPLQRPWIRLLQPDRYARVNEPTEYPKHPR